MAINFDGYSDVSVSETSSETKRGSSKSTDRKMRKNLKRHKKLMRELEEHLAWIKQREVEREVEEAKKASETTKQEPPYLKRIGDAVIKAIPAVLTCIIGFFMRHCFRKLAI